MSDHVAFVKIKSSRLDTIQDVYDYIKKFCPDVVYKTVSNKVLSILMFGGSTHFEFPLITGSLTNQTDTIKIEVITDSDKYPDKVYKVAALGTGNSTIIVMIETTSKDYLYENKKCNIISTYGNDDRLSDATIGEMWIIHEYQEEHHVESFKDKNDALEYFENMKENLMKIKMYNELKNKFANHLLFGGL